MEDGILEQLGKRRYPIDVIVSGLGFMGFGFISSVRHIRGIRVPLLISRRPADAASLLVTHGLPAMVVTHHNDIRKTIADNVIAVSDDVELLAKVPAEVVLEVTGTVHYAAEVALAALSAHKHLVTMNPELQVSVGSQLRTIAQQKRLLMSDVIGDQPGSLARMISHARLMGFEILMAGNMKRYMDIHATQAQMKPWADDKGLAVRQTTSFTDGTKQAIEMTLVANHFGMTVLKRGMIGHTVSGVSDILQRVDWNTVPKEGVVDFVIGRDLFPGIFLVVRHKDPNQQKYLRYLGLGEGRQHVLFEPYHLCHLEVPGTIAKMVLFGQETIHNSDSPKTTTFAMAKRNLTIGEKLDGIGGDMVYGVIDSMEHAQDYLPVGFSDGALLVRDILPDTPIHLTDVILPVTAATKLARLRTILQKPPFFQSMISRFSNLSNFL